MLPRREEATAAQVDALDAFTIEGCATTFRFSARSCSTRAGNAGKLSTAFLAEEFPDGFHRHGAARRESARVLAAVAAAMDHVRAKESAAFPASSPAAR